MTIVNFSTKQYLHGQRRLMGSINGSAHFIGYSDYATIKSPSHQDSPYEFKIHALEKAFEQFPTENIFLWLDSSVFRVGDISIIEDIIKTEGFFGEESGHYCWDWANQRCREYHKLSKEEGLIMYSAGLTGIDRNNPKAMEFFTQWKASAKAGCFKGSHENHRHDMVNASIIAQRLGLKYQRGGTYLAYIGGGYPSPQPEAIFYLQGI